MTKLKVEKLQNKDARPAHSEITVMSDLGDMGQKNSPNDVTVSNKTTRKQLCIYISQFLGAKLVANIVSKTVDMKSAKNPMILKKPILTSEVIVVDKCDTGINRQADPRVSSSVVDECDIGLPSTEQVSCDIPVKRAPDHIGASLTNLSHLHVYASGKLSEQMSFSFGACEKTVFFELGVAFCLQEMIKPDVLKQSKFLGSSYGGIVATALSMDFAIERIYMNLARIDQKSLEKYYCFN
jgi:hypothetical protein